MDTLVYDAIDGKRTAKEALDMATKEWDKLTDYMGREKQIKYYRESLNLKWVLIK